VGVCMCARQTWVVASPCSDKVGLTLWSCCMIVFVFLSHLVAVWVCTYLWERGFGCIVWRGYLKELSGPTTSVEGATSLHQC